MAHLGMCGCKPVLLHTTGEADQRVPAGEAAHIHGDDELRVADAALTRECRAGSRREQKRVLARASPPGHTIGIRVEHGSPQLRVRTVGHVGARELTDHRTQVERQRGFVTKHLDVRFACLPGLEAPQPHTVREAGTHTGGACGASCGEQQARQSWMQRQPAHGVSFCCHVPVRVECAEAFKQVHGGGDRVCRGRLKPLEPPGVTTPCRHIEHGAGQVHAENLRLPMRAQPITRIPETKHGAGLRAACAARALIRRVHRDAFSHQRVHRTPRVVSRDLVQARIDHGGDIGHGECGLGEVGGQHNPRSVAGRQRAVLIVGVESTVQRQHGIHDAVQRTRRLLNLARTGQETQHGATGRGHGPTSRFGHRETGMMRHIQGELPAGDLDHRTVAQERGYTRGVDGRRHDHHTQIVARHPGLFHQRQTQIGVDASFVEFVEHHRTDRRQQRVLMQHRCQHPFGRDRQPRLGRHPAVEPHMPADLAPHRPPTLLCDAPRDGSGGHPAGLQHKDRAILDQRGRHTCGFARAWRGNHDHGPVGGQGCPETREMVINWKRHQHPQRTIINAHVERPNVFVTCLRSVDCGAHDQGVQSALSPALHGAGRTGAHQ